MAAATAFRTWPGLGLSERCSTDANRASAQTALVLGWYIASCILSPLTGLPRTYDATESGSWRRRRLADELFTGPYILWCRPGQASGQWIRLASRLRSAKGR